MRGNNRIKTKGGAVLNRIALLLLVALLAGCSVSSTGGGSASGGGGAPAPLPTLMTDAPPPEALPVEIYIGLGQCATFTRGTDRIDVCQRPGETVSSANCSAQISQLTFGGGDWLDEGETISVDRLSEQQAVVKLHRARRVQWVQASNPPPCN